MCHEMVYHSVILESFLTIHIWHYHRLLLPPIRLHRVWIARIAIAIISLSKCSLLLSILGSFTLAKCSKKLAFKIFSEANESVCFRWEVTALLKPLAIDSTKKLQREHNTYAVSIDTQKIEVIISR